ncbi:MAG: tetratricopeptide repeat protein [Chloroflexota bacterium]
MPADSVPHYPRRIRDLIDLGKLDLALREVRRALQHDPENAEYHYWLAWVLWQQDRRIEALPAAQKALRFAPDDPDHHSLLALVLQEAPLDRPRAEAHHQQAIALAPNVAAFHLRYAEYLRMMGRGEAWQEASRALECDPRLAGAYLLRARLYHDQRRFAEAEAATREALAIRPLDPRAHDLLGDIAFEQYQSKAAFPHYREALRLEPTSERYKQKVIHSLEAGLPAIGKIWNFTHMLHRNERRFIIYYLFVYPVLCCLLNPSLIWLFLLVLCLDILIGIFFVVLSFVVEPLVTKAVLEGRIEP